MDKEAQKGDCIQEIDSQTNLFNCFREMFVLQENMVIATCSYKFQGILL